MRARGVVAIVICIMVAGSGSARLTAAKQGSIKVTITGLGCSTSTGSNSFDARSWSWGAANVTDTTSGGGSGSGKAVVSALSLTRTSDACSPALLGAVTTGKHFPSLSLTQFDDSGAMTATVALEDVTISDWRIGGDNAAGAAEEVQVSFSKFTFTDAASGNKFCWDLSAGKGC